MKRTAACFGFHRHKDTAVAQGYEVNYWVGNDAVERWAAVPPTFTLGTLWRLCL